LRVVANASILIGLSSIGRLALPHERFPDGLLIPPAVWREVVEQGGERPGAREVARAKWIAVRDVTAWEIVQLLEMELEQGKRRRSLWHTSWEQKSSSWTSEMQCGRQSTWVCAS